MSMGQKLGCYRRYYTSKESKIEVGMNSESEEHPNYNVPVTKFGDFYCSLCDTHMNCSTMFESHIKGKRHSKNTRRGFVVQPKYELCDVEPTIQKLLDEESRPIAGLEHLVENVYSNQPPTYHCFLCSANCPSSEWLIDHIMGLKHQMAFLKAHNRELPFGKSEDLSKANLISLVQEQISKYEQEHGRGKMSVRKVKEKSGPFLCIKNGKKEELNFDSKPIGCSPKSKSSPISISTPRPKISKRSPSPKTSKFSPPHKISRHSRSRKISGHSPPPRYIRRSPSPGSFRRSPSPSSFRCRSPSPISSRHSPSLKTLKCSLTPRSLRRSPSPGYSGNFSSPSYQKHFNPSRLSRHSPSPPKSVRMKEQNFQSEWQKVALFEERQREYSDEEKWRKIEHTTFYKQAPIHKRLSKSKSEPTDNYSSELFTDGRNNCSDLRAILDKKKNLGGISRTYAHEPSVQMPFDETYPRNFHDKGFEGIFQNKNSTDVPTQNIQFAHSLDKLIGHYKNRKTTRQENPSSHLMSSEQYNQLNNSQYKNTPERTSSLKDHETILQENDCLKDVESCNLILPKQSDGDIVPPCHQLNSSPYENTSERLFFNSECSQRENSGLPFSSIDRDSTVIPGLTLIEESLTSNSMANNEYSEGARDIFGSITMPSKSLYENKD